MNVENSQKGFITHLLVVVVTLSVLGVMLYFYTSPTREMSKVDKIKIPIVVDIGIKQTNNPAPLVSTSTQPLINIISSSSKPTQVLDEKNRDNIQDLLNRQCQAFSNKDVNLLINTIDQSNASLFQKYKQSVEILFSMTSSVVSCRYEIQEIKFDETTASLTAEVVEKGDLKIKLIDGSIKTMEDPSVFIKERYILSNSIWRQIISN